MGNEALGMLTVRMYVCHTHTLFTYACLIKLEHLQCTVVNLGTNKVLQLTGTISLLAGTYSVARYTFSVKLSDFTVSRDT